jgi:hypothetical protein
MGAKAEDEDEDEEEEYMDLRTSREAGMRAGQEWTVQSIMQVEDSSQRKVDYGSQQSLNYASFAVPYHLVKEAASCLMRC